MEYIKVFSSFSVSNLKEALEFYTEVVGLEVTEEERGLRLNLNGTEIFMYEKPNHTPASFTILDFEVDDIDKAVDMLADKGVEFEHYDMEQIKTDEKGIARSDDLSKGPNTAWFKDPAGNIISVLQS